MMVSAIHDDERLKPFLLTLEIAFV